jgi:hypothetical protein
MGRRRAARVTLKVLWCARQGLAPRKDAPLSVQIAALNPHQRAYHTTQTVLVQANRRLCGITERARDRSGWPAFEGLPASPGAARPTRAGNSPASTMVCGVEKGPVSASNLTVSGHDLIHPVALIGFKYEEDCLIGLGEKIVQGFQDEIGSAPALRCSHLHSGLAGALHRLKGVVLSKIRIPLKPESHHQVA